MKTNGDLLTKKFNPRPKRIFSVELKKKLVLEIEYNRLTVNDVVNMYKVSNQTVYRWLREHSSTYKTGSVMVVESDSKETKIDKLVKYIADLERSLGQKQMEVDFLNNVVDICSEELGYDVKKKCTTTQSSGSK